MNNRATSHPEDTNNLVARQARSLSREARQPWMEEEGGPSKAVNHTMEIATEHVHGPVRSPTVTRPVLRAEGANAYAVDPLL